MRDVGAARHAAEDRTQSRVSKHLLCKYDEGVMHIMLWDGSRDAVQVSRSQAEYVLSPSHRDSLSRLCVGEAGPRTGDDPATVDYFRERAPNSQFSGYSLRRGCCSFDSTLQ